MSEFLESVNRRNLDVPERIAAKKIADALDGMEDRARRRVLRWAFEQFVPPYLALPDPEEKQ